MGMLVLPDGLRPEDVVALERIAADVAAFRRVPDRGGEAFVYDREGHELPRAAATFALAAAMPEGVEPAALGLDGFWPFLEPFKRAASPMADLATAARLIVLELVRRARFGQSERSRLVTAASHPRLFAACEAVSHDMGALAGWSAHRVPDGDLDAIEAALAGLTTEEFRTFTIGDLDERSHLAARSPGHEAAAAALDGFADAYLPEMWPEAEAAADPGFSGVLEEVAAERRRQDARYGGPGHDDGHADGALIVAGAVYALDAAQAVSPHFDAIEVAVSRLRPRSPCGHNPGDAARRRLVKAAALMVAEIQRIDREQSGSAATGAEG